MNFFRFIFDFKFSIKNFIFINIFLYEFQKDDIFLLT